MKRVFQFGLLVIALTAAPLFAQIYGVPPSVTSFTGKFANGPAPSVTSYNGTNIAPGARPSVTSLGPRGYTPGFACASPVGCINPAFTPTIDFTNGRVLLGQKINTRGTHNGRPDHDRRGGYPVYVPYAYPYPVAVDSSAQDEDQPQEEPPGPTVYDRYGNGPYAPMQSGPYEGPRYYDQRAKLADPQPPANAAADAQVSEPPSAPPRSLTPTVLVFKDGHQQQVTNYAIVGDTLFDLGTFVAHRIKLADLDLDQTAKVNEDRGVEFSLPASYKN
ncbi:MAG TPA: hypothetical protein VEG30_07130 [Terriglobales bacterium]|nr:hypothetical protein [Terriglobales bacterium]